MPIAIVMTFCTAMAQGKQEDTLYRTILYNDSLLFDIGFNTCDVKQFEILLSDSFQFYHDNDGFSDKAKFISDFEKGICNVQDNRQVKRFLIKENTEIFPMYKNGQLYGAIQNGSHSFSEKRESESGISKFSHLWVLEKGKWRLATSFSFDHKVLLNLVEDQSIFNNDTAIEKWLKEKKVPILGLGIITDGQLQQIKVYGEMANGKAAPYNTIFNVASLTKPITALLALKLISQGKWNLDEPVCHYWIDSDIINDPYQKLITTRHILSHQTGFANWRWMEKDKKLRFHFKPGTSYKYSGEGMEYLRKALEKKFKKSLQQLAEENIFQPLKMPDTRYTWSSSIDTARLARGYDKDGKVYEVFKNSTANAADDLLTTIEDYSTFLLSLLHADRLSDKMFEEMQTKQVASERGKYFGLGLEIYDLNNGEYALSHGGADDGVRTIFFLLPKTQQGLLIFTNSDTGVNVYEHIIKHYLGANGQKIIDIETQ